MVKLEVVVLLVTLTNPCCPIPDTCNPVKVALVPEALVKMRVVMVALVPVKLVVVNVGMVP